MIRTTSGRVGSKRAPDRVGFVPIPGTKRRKYLAKNVGAEKVALAASDRDEIAAAILQNAAAGERCSAAGMATVNL